MTLSRFLRRLHYTSWICFLQLCLNHDLKMTVFFPFWLFFVYVVYSCEALFLSLSCSNVVWLHNCCILNAKKISLALIRSLLCLFMQSARVFLIEILFCNIDSSGLRNCCTGEEKKNSLEVWLQHFTTC